VAVLILAGPRRPAPPENERILNNILLCVDVSGSMTMPFGGKTRFDAAMGAARDFCEYRKGDAFGLTIFGSDYLHWFPPTKELSAIRNALPFVQPRNLPPWFGGTMIGNALRGCKQRLNRVKEGDRAIILITDGGSADFAGGQDRQVAEELAEHKIRVFTILIGEDMFVGDGVYTIAALTGGKVFRAGDAGTLDTVFREIDGMQKAKFKPITSDWVDYYQPLSLAGLALGGLWALSLLGLRFTPW
jgi:Ca-activated chloride channel family protein